MIDNLDYTNVNYVGTYSTRQAAKKAKVHRVTLQKWVSEGKVTASQQIRLNGSRHWRWTDEDIARIIEYKKEHFGEGKGRRTDLEKKRRKKEKKK